MQHILSRARRRKSQELRECRFGFGKESTLGHCNRQEESGTLFITENKIEKNCPAQQGAVTNMESKCRHGIIDI